MTDQIAEKNNAVQHERIQYIDVLRVLSMLSVVFLHTAAGSLRANIGSPAWHLSNFLTSIMSVSVPIFFMISGAMLLSSGKTLSITFTYKKRIPKVFVPFLTWSLAAVAYFGAMSFRSTGRVDFTAAIDRLKDLPSTPATVHLWFMYALIPLYMLSPILKKLMDSMTQNLLKYMFTIWVVFTTVIPTIAAIVPAGYKSLFELNSSYNLNLMSGYLGYFLFGYYLYNHNETISKKLLTSIIIIDTLVITLGSWYVTVGDGKYSELFKGYTRAFMFILSIAVFLLVKEIFKEYRLRQKIWGVVQFLSSVSFGVYLLHNLLVDLISHKIHLYPANSIYTLAFSYFAVLFASIAFIVCVSSFKPTCFAFTGMSYYSACKNSNIQYFFKKIFGRRTKMIQDAASNTEIHNSAD